MSEIAYRAEYSGHVDGEKVAWMYRAYNEEGAPYVLVLDYEVGPITIVQAPTEFLDGVPDEEVDRENAIDWVHRLTELAQKAKAYDEIFDAIEEAEREPDLANLHDFVDESDESLAMTANLWLPITDENTKKAAHGVYVVDELTDVENDSEWVDHDGDHYKNIDGRWYLSYEGKSQWHVADADELTDYGPYTAVDA